MSAHTQPDRSFPQTQLRQGGLLATAGYGRHGSVASPPSFPIRGMQHRPVLGPVVSSHSEPRAVRVRRAALMTSTGASRSMQWTGRYRMRRKAIHTCNSRQEAYYSPSWRCLP
jgi:hypothetical protein